MPWPDNQGVDIQKTVLLKPADYSFEVYMDLVFDQSRKISS